MLTIKAALAGTLVCAAAATTALAEPKTNMPVSYTHLTLPTILLV